MIDKLLILGGITLALSGCVSTSRPTIRTVEVQVPIPVSCEIEQVPEVELPSARGTTGDIFDDTKLALADREVLKADNIRLRAANSRKCPA
jgi:hypothetical protein